VSAKLRLEVPNGYRISSLMHLPGEAGMRTVGRRCRQISVAGANHSWVSGPDGERRYRAAIANLQTFTGSF
jgi:hypothetical protein